MTFFRQSLNIFRFSPIFSTLPPSHVQSYNYNCTIHLLQLQVTIYNCRNCDQLHVKICPASPVTSHHSLFLYLIFLLLFLYAVSTLTFCISISYTCRPIVMDASCHPCLRRNENATMAVSLHLGCAL